MRSTALLLLLLTSPLLADVTRPAFPDDYVRQTCAPAQPCSSFSRADMPRIAFMRGFTVSGAWLDAHWDEVLAAMQPYCEKAAACFANPANHYLFCNDVIAPEVSRACVVYPEGSEDRKNCELTIRIAWGGFDRTSKPQWQKVQECARAAAAAAERTLDVWIEPASVPWGETVRFTLHAIDRETRIPVQARVAVAGQKLAAVDVPDGKPTANLPIDWKPAYVRVPNAQGHTDVVAPEATVTAPGYAPVTFPMPLAAPKLDVTMKPARLRRGANEVTIEARDASTGKPAELRVMAGTRPVGRTNEPFEIEISGPVPEIWLTSLFDRYGDVVVVPAR